MSYDITCQKSLSQVNKPAAACNHGCILCKNYQPITAALFLVKCSL